MSNEMNQLVNQEYFKFTFDKVRYWMTIRGRKIKNGR